MRTRPANQRPRFFPLPRWLHDDVEDAKRRRASGEITAAEYEAEIEMLGLEHEARMAEYRSGRG